MRADGSCDLGNTPAEGLTDALNPVYGAEAVRELTQIHKAINSMKRAFIAALMVASSAVAVLPNKAEASWANYTARRTCHYMRQGYSARKAGQMGAADTLKSSYAGAAMRAHNNGTMSSTFSAALLRTCPSTLAQ